MFTFQNAVVQNLAVLLSASSGGGGGVGAVAVLLECGCYKRLGAAGSAQSRPGPQQDSTVRAQPGHHRHARHTGKWTLGENTSVVSFLRKVLYPTK